MKPWKWTLQDLKNVDRQIKRDWNEAWDAHYHNPALDRSDTFEKLEQASARLLVALRLSSKRVKQPRKREKTKQRERKGPTGRMCRVWRLK